MPMAIRDQAQTALSQVLLENIRRDSHPSVAQMSMLEQTIPKSMVPEYLNVLLEKVWQERSPSIPMLRRIQRLSEQL
jgi:hypothetical protein